MSKEGSTVKKRGIGPIITDRDEEIVQFLFENKLATSEQIAKEYFKGLSPQMCRKRLKIIQDFGYIEKYGKMASGVFKFFYKCSQKGMKYLESTRDIEVEKRKLSSEATEHDWILVDILKRLSILNSVQKTITENALTSYKRYIYNSKYQSFSVMNSDAFLRILHKGNTFNVALEFENSRQSKGKMETKIKQYYQHGNVHAVFYVARSKSYIKQIESIDRSVCLKGETKLFTCLLKEVLDAKESLTFSNHKKDLIILK